MKRVIEDVPTEQLFAEVSACLVEAEDILLPSVEARIRDVRDACKRGYNALGRLQCQVEREKHK